MLKVQRKFAWENKLKGVRINNSYCEPPSIKNKITFRKKVSKFRIWNGIYSPVNGDRKSSNDKGWWARQGVRGCSSEWVINYVSQLMKMKMREQKREVERYAKEMKRVLTWGCSNEWMRKGILSLLHPQVYSTPCVTGEQQVCSMVKRG
jgi:hypothetical protein